MSDWVEWKGGECPVADKTKVCIRFFDGFEWSQTAGDLHWAHLGGHDDIIAYSVLEPQAHVMSCPVAQGEHAAADCVLELQAEVQRLSAELAHRTEVWEGEEFKLRGELSEARAEIVSLLEEVARLRGCAPVPSRGASPAQAREAKTSDCLDYSGDGKVSVSVDAIISSPNVQRQVEAVERLRKEREDESGGKKCPVVRASIGRDLLNARLNSVVADPLDHRLGLPQPDGDPVAPMSARKPYRWGWQG